MGVPAFFRWLSRKYPSIVANSMEDKQVDVSAYSFCSLILWLGFL